MRVFLDILNKILKEGFNNAHVNPSDLVLDKNSTLEFYGILKIDEACYF